MRGWLYDSERKKLMFSNIIRKKCRIKAPKAPFQNLFGIKGKYSVNDNAVKSKKLVIYGLEDLYFP